MFLILYLQLVCSVLISMFKFVCVVWFKYFRISFWLHQLFYSLWPYLFLEKWVKKHDLDRCYTQNDWNHEFFFLIFVYSQHILVSFKFFCVCQINQIFSYQILLLWLVSCKYLVCTIYDLNAIILYWFKLIKLNNFQAFNRT